MARGRVSRRPGHYWQPVDVKQPRGVSAVRRPDRRRSSGARLRAGVVRRAGVLRGWRLPRPRALPWKPALPRLSARWRRVALAVGAVVIGALGAVSLYQSPWLSIGKVTVEGNATLSTELLIDTAGLEGESVINPDFSAAERRLEALPMVKDAEIGRDWPNGARVIIAERKPWALWRAGTGHVVIDNEGVVLDAPAPAGALVFVQRGARAALEPGDRVDRGAVEVARRLVPTSMRTLGRRVVSLEFSQKTGLTAVLAGPDGERVRARFGDAHAYEFKVAALYAVLRQADQEGRRLSEVDLRFGGRVAVRAREHR